MIRFQKKHVLSLLFGFIFLTLVGAAFYYFSIMKMDERNGTLRQQLLTIQNESSPQEDVPEDMGGDLIALAEKVPVESMEEQIIIDLEKAALGADSVILSIGFNENAVETEDGETDREEIDTTEEYIEEMTPEEEVTVEVASTGLPKGLAQIQIALTVRSKDYGSMTAFLENIRLLPRIYVIESFLFDGFEENETRPGPNEDELEYTVQLVSYYAPVIQTIAASSGVVLPDPAGKENPLHDAKEEEADSIDGWVEDDSLSETTLREFLEMIEQNREDENNEDTGELEEEGSSEEELGAGEPNNSEQAGQYTVQRGDTLFSISMKFYGSREGEALIKEANSKTTELVIIGETLVIP